MKQEDIIRMAREAGFADTQGTVHAAYQLEHFAALVASAEREACAKVCDDNADIEHWQDEKTGGIRTGVHAKLIRARGDSCLI